MTSEDEERTLKLVEEALKKLGEHFSSIQIIATLEDGGDTTMFHQGVGNYYARYGSTVEWLSIQDERMRGYEEDDDDQED